MSNAKTHSVFPGFTALSNQVFVRTNEDIGKHELRPQDPRVIIIYSWGDALPKHITKYADGFRALVYHAKQIAVLSPIFEALSLGIDQRTQSMKVVTQEIVVEEIGSVTDDRILFHVMSNTVGINYAAVSL
ncbi:hypothetical protein FZEAL_4676 [Fusarium zealandicum]|uniref:Uncharacterized protein n=1 Tax=Fusarium zealandicum TaxID=1053134 RepID=A0A8H4XKL0_9HYPO|nr:hypothetical protein FZEAL_4676 [Fusarium zealandicum]